MARPGSSPRIITSRRNLLFLLSILLSVSLARADVLRTKSPGAGFLPLDGSWQFHTGDDPAWADPALKDASWEALRANDTWGAQTHPGYTGWAWYRRQIRVSNVDHPLAVLIPPVDDAYDIYWNGQKIGSYGRLPPHSWWWAHGHSAVYPLPPAQKGALNGVLALRVWKAPLSSTDSDAGGGLNATPLLGNQLVLDPMAAAPLLQREHRELPRLLIAAVLIISGLLSLLLFLRQRTEPLYLWLTLYLLSDGVLGLMGMAGVYYGASFLQLQILSQITGSLSDIPLWLILLTIFGLNHDEEWLYWTRMLAALYIEAQLLDMIVLTFWQDAGSGMQNVDAITTAVYTIAPFFTLFIVAFGLFRHKQMGFWPLAIVAFLYGLWNSVTGIAVQGIRFTHWTFPAILNSWSLRVGTYSFGIRFLLELELLLVILITVTRLQFIERRRQARIEMELKSAQEIQQVLLPEDTPAVPGFAITHAYKPASEVGGDFFQVMPLADGDLLLVLGDVSGKGLKAAMTVSLIVGAVRTIVEFTREPSEILKHLNWRLIGRTNDGFATCLVLRVFPNGHCVIANAGHLAPFLNCEELPVPGSLPLGLDSSAAYEETTFCLFENDTLTMHTDGIIEARGRRGELFGFERLSSHMRARASVEQLVNAACNFGQADDITVLAITRTTNIELNQRDFIPLSAHLTQFVTPESA